MQRIVDPSSSSNFCWVNGADPACAVILLRNLSDVHSIGFLNRVVRAYRSETRKCLGHISTRMQRLRKLFFEDHSTFVNFASTDISKYCFVCHNGNYSCVWGPHFIEMTAQRAWAESLTILQGLCSGRAPQSAKEILLFSLLAKAMSHILDNTGISQLPLEIVKDLGRWQILLQGDSDQQWALKRAVRTVWNVDITQPDRSFLVDEKHLSESLQHLRHAAEDLVARTRHLFASEQTDMSTDTSPFNLPESLDKPSDHLRVTDTANPGPLGTSEDSRSKGTSRLCKESVSLASELIIALAGAIFAVTLAFLISKFTELT